MNASNPLRLLGLALALVVLILPVRARAAEDDAKAQEQAAQAIAAFRKADSGLSKLFDKSAGYVVFPSIAKGGLVFGAAHGKGLVYEKGKLIGTAALTQVTVGAQIGGQAFSEVIFFQNTPALEHFKESNLEMSAQVSAIAAAEGAAQHARYIDGVAVFTRPIRGLMAEASIGGQKLRFTPLGEKKAGKKSGK
jgi:lipid-binding SYLF domain-containing protein